jgi:signal transduction histidine kinase
LLVVGRIKVGQLRKPAGLPSATHAIARDIDDIFMQALTYTRTMIAELSPPSLHESGLPAALRWLGERMHKDGLWVDVQADQEPLLLPEDRAVLLFHSVRELLFNVLKHAGVDRATVRVTVDDSRAVRVIVEDRGRGFTSGDLARSFEPGHAGLAGVRERMEAIGGRLEVSSKPGHGTVMMMVLPMAVDRPEMRS